MELSRSCSLTRPLLEGHTVVVEVALTVVEDLKLGISGEVANEDSNWELDSVPAANEQGTVVEVVNVRWMTLPELDPSVHVSVSVRVTGRTVELTLDVPVSILLSDSVPSLINDPEFKLE